MTTLEQPSEPRPYASPLRLLIIVVTSVFMIEAGVMVLLIILPPLPEIVAAMLDALLLTILIYPVLYRYVMHPMTRHITERQQVENALRRAHDELEVRVQERTEELTIANAELQAEIEKRQRTEVALRRAHDELEQRVQERTAALAQLSSAVEQTADSVVITDRNGVIEYVNPAFEHLTGYSRAETVGQTPRILKSGVHDIPFYEDMWQTILSGEAYFGELTNRKKNGEIFYEVKTIAPIRDAQGVITHFVATGKNITERKRAEEALRASELRFRTVADFTYDWEFWVDPDQRLLYVSPSCERVTGYGAAEFVADPDLLTRIVYPDDRELYASHLHVASRSSDVDPIDFRIMRRDGQVRWIAHVCQPVYDEQGRALGRRISNRDITERKRAEQNLQQSEQKFRALFETAPVGISVLDQDRRLTDANPALERITRLTRAELVAGAHLRRQYIRGDGTPMLSGEFASTRAIAEGKATHDVEVGIVTEDGQAIWTLVSAAPLGLPEAGIVVITQDITERKRAEAQITLQIAAMEAAANGIVITDRAGHIQWTNPAFARMSGYAAQEVLGQNTRLFKSGQYDEAYYRRLWDTILAGQVWHDEIVNRRKDGSLYTEDQTIAPVHDAQGTITHFVSIKQDITEHKQAEQAVQWERAKLKSILSTMQDGVYIVTPDYSIEYINPALEREFGPVNQRKCYEYLFGCTEVCMWCHNQEVFADQTVIWEHDWPGRGKTFELFDTPVRNADGSLSKLAILHDITTRKRTEDEIGRRNRELAALNTVSAAVSRSLELSEVLLTLTHLLPEDLGIPGGAIFLYDDLTDQLQFETGWGTPGALYGGLTAIPANAFHSPQVIRDKEPLLTSDVRHAVESVAAKLRISQPDWQDYLCVPLVAQGRLQGVLDLFSRAPAQFNTDDVRFFKSLGQEVGLAIQNARLYEAEQHARQTAETLRAASLALTQTLDLEAVVNTLLDYVEQLIPYDAANVMLLEAEDRLTTRAVRDYEHREDHDHAHHLTCEVSATPLVQQLFDERRSIIVADGLAQPDRLQWLRLAHARSWLGVPLIAGGNIIGLYSLIKTEPNYFTLRHMQLAEALVGQAAVAVQNAWLFEQVRQGRERLQDLSRRLVEVQESERRYIARELHDEAGQALTSLMVGLRLLERDAGQPEALKLGIAELNRLVDGVQENLHRLAVDLRPASLDHLGLVAALRQYVEGLSDKHGLVVQLEAVGLGQERLPSDIETAVYRIVQEALTNVIRHARATRVDVLLERRGDRLVAMVEDNGIGFDVVQPQTGRLGLFGIRERAEMLGGTLLIESSEHSGTTLVAEVSCVS